MLGNEGQSAVESFIREEVRHSLPNEYGFGFFRIAGAKNHDLLKPVAKLFFEEIIDVSFPGQNEGFRARE